jgi:F-type H+-transporting ATPase subunit a
MINISLQPESIGLINQLKITNSFLTTILVSYLIVFILIVFSLFEKKKNFFTSTIYYAFKRFLLFLDQFTQDRTVTLKFFPLIATFFIFILFSNLIELLPGFSGALFQIVAGKSVPLLRSPSSDLNTTLALSIISVIAIQYYSYKSLGWSGFIRRFINPKSPVELILGLFDLLSELIKVISFSFRLFGNLFAGEVILLVSAFFAPLFVPLPFMVLELFVGIIQAFIFALLTLTFIMIARNDSRSLPAREEVDE